MSKKLTFDTKEWFMETSFPGVRRCKMDGFHIDKEIFKGKSKFQNIQVFNSRGFGRMLALDGIIQFSQSDEFIYHEMIAHVPLMTHPRPKRFLVVGGGDGGVLREARKHSLEKLYQVEIDRQIVDICKKYLPFVSKGAFSDKRFKISFEDGKNFIKRFKDFFDVIIVDSTDPVGPGEVLFKRDFYQTVFEALRKDGIAVFQLGPFLDFDLIVRPTAKKLKKYAKYINTIRLPMPSYSCGCEYCFMIASKKIDPAKVSPAVLKKRFRQRFGAKAKELKYYSPEVHKASLVQPRIWQL